MHSEEQVEVLIQLLDSDIPAPKYAKPGDAGADLCTTEDVTIAPSERVMVGTGVAIALPNGYVGLVHPRSGLAVKKGITIVNAPGTVDAGYRGEIKICLLNTDLKESVEFKRGDRIAQLVIQKFETANFVTVKQLPSSERGAAGFGSTGGFAEKNEEHN
ncbi:MAG: dUTP diphosphatase [Micrococcaceae bacterium]